MFCFVRCSDFREGDQSLTNTGVFVKEVCSPQTEATTWPEGDALLKKQSVKKDKEKGVEGGRKTLAAQRRNSAVQRTCPWSRQN